MLSNRFGSATFAHDSRRRRRMLRSVQRTVKALHIAARAYDACGTSPRTSFAALLRGSQWLRAGRRLVDVCARRTMTTRRLGASPLARAPRIGVNCRSAASRPLGEEWRRAGSRVTLALEDAGVAPSKLNYVNLHRTSTDSNEPGGDSARSSWHWAHAPSRFRLRL